MSAKAQLLALLQLEGLGTEWVRQLIQTFGSPSAIFAADAESLMEAGVEEKIAQAIAMADEEAIWSLEIQLMDYEDQSGVRFVPIGAPEYPPNLLEIEAAPLFLWCQGEILPQDQRAVAVVGARRASMRGTSNAQRIAMSLAAQEVTVVSGLALGVDTAAHQGALDAGGRTIAVLGSGIEMIVPEENRGLATRIARQGAIVSELLRTDAFPSRQHFFDRNRIITGLSKVVIVVEAEADSGSVDTGLKALEQGRELLVVVPEQGLPPGNEQLLGMGGVPVSSVNEIFEALGELRVRRAAEEQLRDLRGR
ncbi:MAG: DNA-processing protein DprA [Anaerolineae bacterium]